VLKAKIFLLQALAESNHTNDLTELVAIEDSSITLMSPVTTCQIGRTLSERTCSGIVSALLPFCSIMSFSEANAGTSFSKILAGSSLLHVHKRARL